MKTFIALILFFGSFALADVDYQYFENNGVKIGYRVFGSGQPLIVLNGGPGRNSLSFTALAETLSSKRFQVILFDQRGTGESKIEINEQTITLDLMVSDLEALRKHLQYDRVAILGHSFGGMYAMAYASVYPEHIKTLILSASGGIDLSWMDYAFHNMLSRLSEEDRIEYNFWTSDDQMKKDPVKANQEATRLLAPAYVYNQKFAPQIAEALTNLKYYTPGVNGLVWKSMKNYNLKGQLKALSAPTLILAGRQDILGEAVPMAIRDEIPNSRLEFMDECGHYPWLDRPDRYFPLIEEHLSSL
jgi:proline iminopeptidase